MRKFKLEQLEVRRLLTVDSTLIPLLEVRPAEVVTYDTPGKQVVTAVVADVDGNGTDDFIVANDADVGFFVTLFNSDGTPVDEEPLWIAFPGLVTSITTADFNGDGLIDALATSELGATLLVNDGLDDQQIWQGMTGRDFLAGSAVSAATGDLNGDDIPDVVVGAHTAVEVHSGAGDGTVADPISYGAGIGERHVQIADVNNDGALDIVSGLSETNSITVFINVGEGIFEAANDGFPVGEPLSTVTVADTDNDGIVDIIVGHSIQEGNNLSIWKGNGDGTFADSPEGHEIFGPVLEIEAADFDQDGHTDLSVRHGGTFHHPVNRNGPGGVSLMTANTTGGFYDAIRVITDDIRASALNDFDKDGLLDIVAFPQAGGDASLVRRSDAGFTSDRAFDYQLDADEIIFEDLDGDGTPEAIVLNMDELGTSAVSLLARDELGDYTVLDTMNLPVTADGFFVASFRNDEVGNLAAVVIGRDNIGDSHIWSLPLGAESFLSAEDFDLGAEAWSELAIADLNSDGLSDIIGVVTRNDELQIASLVAVGDGSWSEMAGSPIPSIVRPHLADANGDDVVDILYTVNNSTSILQGNNDGTFETLPPVAAGFAALGDFNGDGNVDLLQQAGFFDVTLSVALGIGDGTFQASEELITLDSFVLPGVADLNADGFDDVVVVNDVFLGGAEEFKAATYPLKSVGDPLTGNMDGDDNGDFIVLSAELGLSSSFSFTMLNEARGMEDGSFDITTRIAKFFGLEEFRVLDIDGDSDLDTVIIHADGFAVAINDSPSRIAGDLNGDGSVDVSDIDLLCERHGTQDPSELETFDLTEDGIVDMADTNFLIESILGTRAGDADLDGEVGFSDFLSLSGNFGAIDASWAQGDFDCDGEVGFVDFLMLSSNFGFVAPVTSEAALGSTSGTLATNVAAAASVFESQSDDDDDEESPFST